MSTHFLLGNQPGDIKQIISQLNYLSTAGVLIWFGSPAPVLRPAFTYQPKPLWLLWVWTSIVSPAMATCGAGGHQPPSFLPGQATGLPGVTTLLLIMMGVQLRDNNNPGM